MRPALLALLIAATFAPGAARAVEPTSAAQARAALYQGEVRAEFVKRGWRVTRDEAGKLAVEQRRIDRNGTAEFLLADDNKYSHLEIAFRADGKNHTTTSARASLCSYDSPSSPRVGFMTYPPLALRDPNVTREYLEVLAEAETRLAASHRAYAAAGAGSPREASGSGRIAAK